MLISIEGAQASGKTRCLKFLQDLLAEEKITAHRSELFDRNPELALAHLWCDSLPDSTADKLTKRISRNIGEQALRLAADRLLEKAASPEVYLVEGLTSVAAEVYLGNPGKMYEIVLRSGLLFQILVNVSESERQDRLQRPSNWRLPLRAPLELCRIDSNFNIKHLNMFRTLVVGSFAPSQTLADLSTKVVPLIKTLVGAEYVGMADMIRSTGIGDAVVPLSEDHLPESNLVHRFLTLKWPAPLRPRSLSGEGITCALLRHADDDSKTFLATGWMGEHCPHVTIEASPELRAIYGLPVLLSTIGN